MAKTKREWAIEKARREVTEVGGRPMSLETATHMIETFEAVMEKDDDLYFPPYKEGKDCDFNASRDENGTVELFLRHPNPRFTDCGRYLSPEEQVKLGKWLLGEHHDD